MQAIVSATSVLATGHSTIVECRLAYITSSGNPEIAKVSYKRDKVGDPLERFLSRVSSVGVKALNQPCSSRKMQGFEPNTLGITRGSGVDHCGGIGRELSTKAGGEKTAVDRNAEYVMIDSNSNQSSIPGIICPSASTVGKSTNIVWQECSVNKEEREKLLRQKGCVIWITGLSGSGKSTLACALSRALHCQGKLTYILDGDNVRHGLNKNLGFSEEDRAENIRRVGEVAKLFVDAGVICIASLISPYQRDRDACRALLPAGEFIEIFMNFPLEICEERDSKGLYKLARAGKIKGFTGIDDPYETPVSCEIMMQPIDGVCPSPKDMAEQVVSYLREKGFI